MPNFVKEWAVLLRSREVLASNIGLKACLYRGSIRGLCQELANPVTSPHLLGHECFVSYPSQLIIFISLPTLEATESFVNP